MTSSAKFTINPAFQFLMKTTPSEMVELYFKKASRLTEKYPVGSYVTLDLGAMMDVDSDRFEMQKVRTQVLSEFIYLSNKGFIGFLCSESVDDGDMYNAWDILEEKAKAEIAYGTTGEDNTCI